MAPVVDLSQFAQKNSPQSGSVRGRAGQVAGAGTASGAAGASRTGAGDAGAVVHGALIVAVTKDNLQEVVTTSMQLPVVVVFHSQHSPNSATLVQRFEDLVHAEHGRFQLATVDTDSQSEVTAAFGVSAVPTAAALIQGQPIPLFQGLPEEAAIADAMEKLLATAAHYGLNGHLDGEREPEPAAPEIPPAYKDGIDALNAGDFERARDAFTQALKDNPGDEIALRYLHQSELYQRLARLNPDNSASSAQDILAAAATAPLSQLQPHLDAADIEFSLGQQESAFRRLIAVVAATQADVRDSARLRLLELFSLAEESNPEGVKQARKALTNVLF
ncbi:MAG: tetratricopeptide repeat protein [Actinomycetaceae bacterium]|nr:tetratricopeptide repeat protein [Arcanobacterium sp.]MDD7687487.1 tetratricopeptide repeat protein [Actinomycetaceae bacterium]MDY5272962.1 tetratricopeptide repeat protein [Arcanobacterium sp.]